ncbi:MAG: hypothetical protein ISS26_04280 [Candidatus Omnitrophica bacterium]|nr:hypothetical protein [Candidatus Omnitrophota bacterium]
MATGLFTNREQARRLIVNLVFVIYWLLIVEGAFRKWMFPQYHRYIFFIRDPFVILVYWLAFSNRLFPKKMPIYTYGFSMTVVFLLFALLQSITTRVGIVTLIYGWRMYFFYFPLAFIIGENFSGEDLKRLVRQTLFIAIPMGALVYAQHISPPTSFINQTAESDIIYTITGMRGGTVVRPTGTFTFFHGQQLFIGSVVAFLFTAWILPKKDRPCGIKVLWLASLAAIANLAVSGTRLPYILTALASLAAAFSAFVVRRQKISARAIMLPIALIIIGIFCFVWFFATVAEITLDRHRGAEATEGSIFIRIGRMLFQFADYISRTPTLGVGIGSHTSGGAALATGVRIEAGVEDEWSRIIVETGPIFGLIYITFRILLVWWIFVGALKATHISSNPLPILLFSFIGSVMLAWATTNYGTEMGYAWLFIGFCVAANKLGSKEQEIWA